jgi:hypothetical protein
MSIARFIRDELFWENGKTVFKKNWWVCLHGNSEELKKKNPNTIPVICFKEVN